VKGAGMKDVEKELLQEQKQTSLKSVLPDPIIDEARKKFM
jgi:hypothetical protein